MTDTMLFGVLKMPFQMAMKDEISRIQFYGRVQELVGRFEAQQQAEPVQERSDGMPTSKAERDLRRMLCIARHGGSAYMDDGEASFCGDAYCRSIDYMRESIESIRQAWYDAGVKRLSGAQPEQQAEPVSQAVIAGALFDFMGWLTTRKERLILSSTDNASPAVESITEFAEMRGLSLTDARVQDWQNYTTSPRRKELSASEILDMMPSTIPAEYDGPLMEFARAVEAKLKERNGY